jgi:hypothetical protein
VIRAIVVDDDEFPGEIAGHSHRGKRVKGSPQRFCTIESTDGNRYEHRYCPPLKLSRPPT